jgi:hypothetical protein
MGVWGYKPECDDSVVDFICNTINGKQWETKFDLLRETFNKCTIDNVFWYAGVVRTINDTKKNRRIPKDIWERVYISLKLAPLFSGWENYINQKRNEISARSVYREIVKEALNSLSPFRRKVMLRFTVVMNKSEITNPGDMLKKYLEFKKFEKIKTKTINRYSEKRVRVSQLSRMLGSLL